MSWSWSEIAGKAEDFLNKIDQNAAVALTQATTSNGNSSSRSGKASASGKVRDDTEDLTDSDKIISSSTLDYSLGSSIIPPTLTNSSHSELTKSNSHRKANLDISTAADAETSKLPDVRILSDAVTNVSQNSRPSSKEKKGRKAGGTKLSKSPTYSSTKNEVSAVVEASPVSKSVAAVPVHKEPAESELMDFLNDSSKKDLDEKTGLQNELVNQAREFKMVLASNQKLKLENDMLKKNQLESEEMAKVKDDTESSQLQSSLTDARQELKQLKTLLKKKDGEVSSLKAGLDQTLERMKQLELLQESQNRLEFIEMEKENLAKANDELQQQIFNLSTQVETSASAAASMKRTLATVEVEFANYKDKAKSILKQKDDLIALSHDSQGSSRDSSQTGLDNPFLPEVNALKSERELLNAEISQSRATVESLREEVRRLETDVTTNRSIVTQLQRQLTREKQSSSSLQEENLQQRQQVSVLQFELEKEKSEKRKLEETKSRYENDEATQSARVSPDPRHSASNYSENDENLRTRITALSQALLEKQSLVNNLSADKQLLQIKAERLQEEMRRMGNEISANSSGFSHTVVSNQPLYLSESPWDSGMSTGVKRAFSTVDSLCCQAGLALRRRPNLRLGFCAYIIMLHLWVFFILFHSFSHVPHPTESTNGPSPGGI